MVLTSSGQHCTLVGICASLQRTLQSSQQQLFYASTMNPPTRAQNEHLLHNNAGNDVPNVAPSSSACFNWSSPFAATSNGNANNHVSSINDATTIEEIDKFLATSMAELSFQERQAYQEDLHGVSTSNLEDPDEIEKWLNDLDVHLKKIKGGSTYEKAEDMDSSYVTNRDFRIMFIRGNRYKTREASKQILAFFEMKQTLFGQDKLVKDITLDDLDEEDKANLKSGSFQVLPCKDRTGRHIALGLPGLARNGKLENDLRARYYFFMSLLKSQQTQIKGVVVISYTIGDFKDKSQGAGFIGQTQLSIALPIHFSGIHLCSDDHFQYVLISTCLKLIPSQMRARFKVHFGSHMECQYGLKAYGIPPEALPTSPRLNEHMRWYNACELQEAPSSSSIILQRLPVEPLSNDVLFGGKKNNNGGNRRLRALVRSTSTEYDTGTKQEKRHLIDHVVNEIQITGGRFLKQSESDSGRWEEISLEDACSKIAQAFRNNRRARANLMPAAASAQDKETVNRPTSNDVLFGRKRSNDGNKRVRQLVGDLSNEYDTASKARKTQIADSVVQEIQRHGGRFLKQKEDHQWEEVPNDFARSKISKHFRNNRRPPLVSSKETSSDVGGSSANSELFN